MFASDAASNDMFGGNVALHGSTAMVSAHGDDHAGGTNAGSVYVFEDGINGWQEVTKLTASDAAEGDYFGGSIDLDLDTVAVSAFNKLGPRSGYVFMRNQGGVGSWGEAASFDVEGLYAGVVAVSGDLVALDEAMPTIIIEDIDGLAFDSTTGLLFGADDSPPLVMLDPVSGVAKAIGQMLGSIAGLAFDPATGTLYGSDVYWDQLVRIDTVTGSVTPIGPLGFTAVRGLEFDPTTGTLYGADSTSDQLLEIDVQTGAASVVGKLGVVASGLSGLAFDPNTGTLYGSDDLWNRLVEIDVQTGKASIIGPTGIPDVDGLAFDPATNTLYGTSPMTLSSIDQTLGTANPIGTYFVEPTNLIHVFRLTHTSEDLLHRWNVGERLHGADRGERPGERGRAEWVRALGLRRGGSRGRALLLWNARQAGGPVGQRDQLPVRRAAAEGATGLLHGAGTPGACDGAFTRDLNALWCPGCPVPELNPGAGAMAQAQLWYRDPLNTSNQPTSLSDAIEFSVVP